MSEVLAPQLIDWQQAARREAESIADWWATYTVDEHHGGFYGEVGRNNTPVIESEKSIIQNTRILWFFSEYAHFLKTKSLKGRGSKSERYEALATRAFDYLLRYFDDKEQGGVVWQLDHQGQVTDGKKQTYAISFAIYGLSAYYKLTNNPQALAKAQEYFGLLEKHARDHERNGYVEALSQDWQALADVRLSDKDDNLPKTMNTHLHVLEAYTSLHLVAPTAQTAEALANLIDLFNDRIIDHDSGHLRLFMEMDWQDKSTLWSYGHDIECSWLLFEALEALGDEERLQRLTPVVLKLADTTLAEGIGERGQVLDQFDCIKRTNHPESHWWVQAEALVGFLNAYYLNGNEELLPLYESIWQFICDFHKDVEFGEWHWLATIDQANHPEVYKAGGWKAPYHNGRAMMEICKLVDRIQHKNN
ncbi:AGE family epimerase/isomerase [Neiella sp. HB171785]|uniref:Cellobiose 2-epimerase n=1 Tax=Neiella litorisoli TaxID=2771431 RepID=A0A8J6R2P4_9GAMM|nr:AGE family epimerase/isomerase [Neiella litorisoli]MBD1389155.1 AGE family epimerase/isomerase [Neiella litorisoli]